MLYSNNEAIKMPVFWLFVFRKKRKLIFHKNELKKKNTKYLFQRMLQQYSIENMKIKGICSKYYCILYVCVKFTLLPVSSAY